MFDFLKKRPKKKEDRGENRQDTTVNKMVTENTSNEEVIKNNEPSFALYMLFYDSFALKNEEVEERIKQIDNDKVWMKPLFDLDGKEGLYCYVGINNHTFRLFGIDAPIPNEIADYTINCSYGNEVELLRMKEHKYHIIAFYEGECKDKNEILNAYSKLAYGFLNCDLVGLANPYSWNSLIPSLIEGMVEDEKAKIFATTPAMMVWRSFIKIPYNNGVWFVTKGNNLYDIYEYAYFGNLEETQEIYDIFESIFNYAYETKAVIMAGHTIQVDENTYLKFREVYELENDIQGEGIGTLVIEKITEDKINK